jgi:ribosomal protein S18 acetylase RimI-like enzyme
MPSGPETGSSSALRCDAKTLNDTMRLAIDTSPEAFLRTAEDLDGRSLDYWIDEILSSTWAVALHKGEVVGVAACKRPDPHKDKENHVTARYIESVWIAPHLRGRRLGERLIKYLLMKEYRINLHIRQFLLWVFTTNSPAIRLYENMGFVRTGESKDVFGITEVKYRLEFNPEVNMAIRSEVNEAVRRQVQRQYGVTYRVLGRQDPRSRGQFPRSAPDH